MAKLNVGDKFIPIFPGSSSLIFEVVSLDRRENKLEVRVTNDKGNVWREQWDLDDTEMGIGISEYTILLNKNYKQ